MVSRTASRVPAGGDTAMRMPGAVRSTCATSIRAGRGADTVTSVSVTPRNGRVVTGVWAAPERVSTHRASVRTNRRRSITTPRL